MHEQASCLLGYPIPPIVEKNLLGHVISRQVVPKDLPFRSPNHEAVTKTNQSLYNRLLVLRILNSPGYFSFFP